MLNELEKSWLVVIDKASGRAGALPYNFELLLRLYSGHPECRIERVSAPNENVAILRALASYKTRLFMALKESMLAYGEAVTYDDLKAFFDAIWLELVRRTVKEFEGDVKAAADKLGVSKFTIYTLLDR